MIIALASEGLDPGSLVAEKFGRSPFITFYNTEINTFESLRNPYANLCGGAGIQTSQFVIGKNAAAVIAIEIGLNPFRLLKSADVEIYSCAKIRVIEAVNQFAEGKLSIINQELSNEFGKQGCGRRRRNHNNNF
jgi:predicted Fe-Mo cluster-binding NifX family protein